MGFGSYDESEHEHREEKKDVNAETEHTRKEHNGDVSLDGDNDVDDLLDTFEDIS